jgi:site-specific DNA recombinase
VARTPDKAAGQPVRAAIYCRISDDQANGWGIGDQEHHCRKLADRLGWEVVDVYADNDISISKYSKRKREHFDRLLQDIAAERVGAILVTESSRLFRRELEGLQFQDDYGDPYGLKVRGLDFAVDFATGEGVFGWKLKALVDAEESERTRQRIIRKELSNAEAGLPKKGGIRRFGYAADAVTIIPEEADLIRDAAKRFLAGESLGDIVRHWNKTGLRPPPHNKRTPDGIITIPGNEWRVTTVRNVLSSPYIAGYRSHHTAGMVRGIWKPILDKATWDLVQARLNEPDRLKAGPPRVRRYLLSGFVYCGICQQRMTASPRADKSRTYVCRRGPGLPNCGHLRRKAEPVEELITKYIFQLIENTPDIASGLNPNSETEARIALLARQIERYEEKLEEASNDYYIEETTTKEQFLTATRNLEKKIAACQRERRRLLGGMTLVSLGDTPVREAWATRGLSWRRQLVAALIEKVIIHAVNKPGRSKFDPGKIEVIWRDRPAANKP